MLNEDGHSVKTMNVSDMVPFPKNEVNAFLEDVDEVLVVEMNATAQFRRHIQAATGQHGDKLFSLLKYDGNPFEPSEVVDGFEAQIDGDAEPAHNTRIESATGD